MRLGYVSNCCVRQTPSKCRRKDYCERTNSNPMYYVMRIVLLVHFNPPCITTATTSRFFMGDNHQNTACFRSGSRDELVLSQNGYSNIETLTSSKRACCVLGDFGLPKNVLSKHLKAKCHSTVGEGTEPDFISNEANWQIEHSSSSRYTHPRKLGKYSCCCFT